MKHNKLVRDNILQHIKDHQGTPIYHIADDEEYWDKLRDKLLEECEEFTRDETIEELADLLEVIDAIATYKGFTTHDIQNVKRAKKKERGGFSKRIILDES